LKGLLQTYERNREYHWMVHREENSRVLRRLTLLVSIARFQNNKIIDI